MTQRRDQSAHDTMVGNLADSLIRFGYSDVMADVPGYPQPPIIGWPQTPLYHRPDITATANEVFHIFEIETDDSIMDQHTATQWVLFALYATALNGTFAVVVPIGYEILARLRLAQLGIYAQVLAI